MSITMIKNIIGKHYVNVILPNPDFLNDNPVKDKDLLFPPFADLMLKLNELSLETLGYGFKYTETYRSNNLQLNYYNRGLSKIRSNGMHHYGIAADTIFFRNGEATYKGDFKKLHELFERLGGSDLGGLEIWDAGHFQFIPISQQKNLRNEITITVMEFQKKNSLTVDGIAGPKTHTKAVELFNAGELLI